MKHEVYQNDIDQNSASSTETESEKPSTLINIEEAMEIVGQKHKYQIQVLIISFIVSFFLAYGYMVLPYFFSAPEFQCFIDGDWQVCNETDGACDTKIQSRQIRKKESTIATDFELYCDHRSARVVIESFPLLASILGSFVFIQISEKYGRRIALQMCWVTAVASCFILNFSGNVASLALGAFGVGFSALILQMVIIVHLNELSIGQFRVLALVGVFIFWSISEMQYIWMLALIPNWRWNMFTFYSLPLCILMLVTARMFHDSPRYLYLKDRAKCLESLNRIAKFNGRHTIQDNQLVEYKGSTNYNYNYLHLFQFPSQRRITMKMSLIFLFVNFLYQGTQVVLDTVGSSFVESSLYVGIGELIGNIISEVIGNKTPRRIGIFLSFGATAIICISFAFFKIPSDCALDEDQECWQKPLQGFMISFARGITSITFGLQTLMCGEVYPVAMKSIGIGFSIAVGYLGTFIAPYVVDLAKSLNIQPIVFMGIISFFGNFTTLFTNESMNQPVTQDIPEIEEAQKSQDQKQEIGENSEIKDIRKDKLKLLSTS